MTHTNSLFTEPDLSSWGAVRPEPEQILIPEAIEAVSYTHLDVYKRQLLSYTFFSLILESLWFYVGLSVGTYPTRFLGKMTGTNDQFTMIRKDEALHYSVGLTVIGDIIRESPHIDRDRLNRKILNLVSEGLRLEDNFADETYKDLPGMSAAAYKEQCLSLIHIYRSWRH